MNILAVSTSEVVPVHTDFIVGQGGRRVLGTDQGGGWRARGSAFAGQGGHAGQGRQQPSVYVDPAEEHGLMQPFIVVVEQHGCVVHG